MAGTVEVVAFTELASDTLRGVGACVADADAAGADASSLADRRLVRPLALLVEGRRGEAGRVALALLAHVGSDAAAYTTDEIAMTPTFLGSLSDPVLAGTLAITEDVHVDDETLVETRGTDAKNEVSLVDAMSRLEGDLEGDLVAHLDAVADIRVPQSCSIETE